MLPITTRANLAKELGENVDQVLVHEVWDYPHVGGRIRLWCRGRCYRGPPKIDDSFYCCAWTSILCPSTFFFLVCAPGLWWLWSPWSWLPVVAGVLLAITVTFSFLTSCTDPGIIPRPALQLLVPGLQEEVARANGLENKRGGQMSDVMTVMPDPSIMAVLELEGYWWCRWCHMVQPPRAKHCRDCDCCVLLEDHHCPFLNNCIGQRNYLYFNIFVGFLTTFAIVAVVGIFIWMRQSGHWQCFMELGDCSEDPLRLCVAIVGAFLVVFPGILIVLLSGFLFFHIVNIIRNRTTREVLTGRVVAEGAHALCHARGPSMLHARDPILLSVS